MTTPTYAHTHKDTEHDDNSFPYIVFAKYNYEVIMLLTLQFSNVQNLNNIEWG